MLPPIFSTSSYPAGDFTFEHYRQPAFALLPQAFLMCSILIKLDGPSNIEINCGEKLTLRRLSRGDVIIIPDRFSIEGAHVEACEFLQLCLNPSVVDRSAKELGLGDHVELAPVLGVVDPLAEQTIYLLEEELTSSPGSNDYINVLVDTLAKHLVKYYTESTWTRNKIGGFPEYLLDRIKNRLMNELNQKEAEILPYPLQRMLMKNLSIAAEAAGRADLMPLWAGQSANLSTCTDVSVFLNSLVEEVSEIAGRLTEWNAKRRRKK